MSPLTHLHDWLVERKLIEDSEDANLQIVRMWTLVEAEGVAIYPSKLTSHDGTPCWLAAYHFGDPVEGPTMLIAALRAIWRKLDRRP